MTPENPDLLGLRREDLDPEEQEQLSAVECDPTLSDRVEREHRLAADLSSLPTGGGPSFERLEARMNRREEPPARGGRAWLGLAAAGLMAATALFLVLPSSPTQRDRGGAAAGAMHVEVAVESAMGVRPYRGEQLASDERVLFRVTTAEPGYLRVEEGSHPMATFPADGALRVGKGSHAIGDGAGLVSFRPDASGTTDYRIVFCRTETSTDCLAQVVPVTWE